jgi:hypothetical protein
MASPPVWAAHARLLGQVLNGSVQIPQHFGSSPLIVSRDGIVDMVKVG